MATTIFEMTFSFEQTTESVLAVKDNISQDPMSCSMGIPGLVSNETNRGLDNFSTSYRRVHGYIAVAVCLFGVLSNSANIIVLTRKNMASSTNTILLWLAVSDLLTMLSYLPFAIHFYIMEPFDRSRPPFSSPEFPWICLLLFHASFSIVCHTIAIWLTIALAIFRYIYICKPTKGAFYCSQQRARKVVLVVIVLTILICIPNYGVNTYIYHEGKVNETLSNQTLLASNHSGPQITQLDASYYYATTRDTTTLGKTLTQVNYWIQAILVKLVPCGMLTALTLLLIHAMHKAYRKRMKLKSQGRKAESDKHGEHNRTTGMLLAIVVLFTLTELPQGILTLMNIFISCFTEIVYYRLGDLLDIMALINNSVNFVLYCIMSTQFRNTFSEIFCFPSKNRPKWLKMRLVNSNAHKNTIEVADKKAKGDKMKRNGEVLNANGHDVSKSGEYTPSMPKQHEHVKNTEPEDFSVDSERAALTASEAKSVSHTHTHTYTPDQTMV